MRTSFPGENGESTSAPKILQTFPGHLETEIEQNVKFPKRLRHRGKGKVLVTIYKHTDSYRLYWRTRVGKDGVYRKN